MPKYATLTDKRADDQLLTAQDVAKLLSVKPKTVYGLNIPCVRLSVRRKRWKRSEVCKWIDERRQGGPYE